MVDVEDEDDQQANNDDGDDDWEDDDGAVNGKNEIWDESKAPL